MAPSPLDLINDAYIKKVASENAATGVGPSSPEISVPDLLRFQPTPAAQLNPPPLLNTQAPQPAPAPPPPQPNNGFSISPQVLQQALAIQNALTTNPQNPIQALAGNLGLSFNTLGIPPTLSSAYQNQLLRSGILQQGIGSSLAAELASIPAIQSLLSPGALSGGPNQVSPTLNPLVLQAALQALGELIGGGQTNAT